MNFKGSIHHLCLLTLLCALGSASVFDRHKKEFTSKERWVTTEVRNWELRDVTEFLSKIGTTYKFRRLDAAFHATIKKLIPEEKKELDLANGSKAERKQVIKYFGRELFTKYTALTRVEDRKKEDKQNCFKAVTDLSKHIQRQHVHGKPRLYVVEHPKFKVMDSMDSMQARTEGEEICADAVDSDIIDGMMASDSSSPSGPPTRAEEFAERIGRQSKLGPITEGVVMSPEKLELMEKLKNEKVEDLKQILAKLESERSGKKHRLAWVCRDKDIKPGVKIGTGQESDDKDSAGHPHPHLSTGKDLHSNLDDKPNCYNPDNREITKQRPTEYRLPEESPAQRTHV